MTRSQPTNVAANLERWPTMADQEATNMQFVGASPWGNTWPEGIWCWDEAADEVLVGTCPDDAEILTYAEARERFGD